MNPPRITSNCLSFVVFCFGLNENTTEFILKLKKGNVRILKGRILVIVALQKQRMGLGI